MIGWKIPAFWIELKVQLVLYELFDSSVNSFCLRLGVNKTQKIIHVPDIHIDVQCPFYVLVKLV